MNKKRITLLVLCAIFAIAILGGCGAQQPAPQQETPKTNEPEKPNTDAVTTASIVNNGEAFLKAASKDGTWIIATLNDLTIDKEIVLEGEFKNKDVVARKIALYTQDDDHKVTARFSLKAPKLTVKSENARIQSGTFVGDVYVEAKGFSLVDAKVEGNVYFASEEVKSTFKMDDKSSVTGKQEVKQ